MRYCNEFWRCDCIDCGRCGTEIQRRLERDSFIRELEALANQKPEPPDDLSVN